jgi:tetratricopeptide (TPR) repeat protein
MQQMLGKVEVVNEVRVAGISDANILAQNGETFLKFKEWDKALNVYEKMIQHYPSDYRSWWGKLLVKTENLTLNPWAFEDYYKKALTVATPDSQAMLKKQFNDSAGKIEKTLEKLRSGLAVKEKSKKYLFYVASADTSPYLVFVINRKGEISHPVQYYSVGIIFGSTTYTTYRWHKIGMNGYFEYRVDSRNIKAWILQLSDNYARLMIGHIPEYKNERECSAGTTYSLSDEKFKFSEDL